MPSRRSFIIALALMAAAGPVLAAEPTAQEFLAAIYAKYNGKDAKGQSLNGAAALNRLFTPALARLIDADAKAAAKKGEVGKLDGDPFVDAQDFEIGDVKIDVKESAPDKATAVATFKNFGKDVTISYELVKLKQGWRIDDIRMPSGSLRGLFKKA
jgi:hypothetical protein